MTAYTVKRLDEVDDALGAYPGEMRFLAGPLGAEQVAITHRRMPALTGGKGAYGHRHRTQEEIYFVVSGELEFKLEDDVVPVGPGTAVRVAPGTTRSVWNEGPEDVHLVIVSVKLDAPHLDVERVPDFWPH